MFDRSRGTQYNASWLRRMLPMSGVLWHVNSKLRLLLSRARVAHGRF